MAESGHVIGVDMTPEMLLLDRKIQEKVGAKNVEFCLGEIEHLPVTDNSIEVVMSNCVIILNPDREQVFREVFRALNRAGCWRSAIISRSKSEIGRNKYGE